MVILAEVAGTLGKNGSVRGYDNTSYGDGFADVYDDWYAGISDVEATVRTLAELADGGNVLELGVGTGRLAVPLASIGQERGFTVHGVDSSQAMLDRLATKQAGATASSVVTHVGDMVDDMPAGKYSVVLAAYNTFWNLLSEERQRRCFKEVAQRLTETGVFVVEAYVPDPSMHDPPSQVSVRSIAVDRVVLSVSLAAGVGGLGGADEQRVDGHFVDITATTDQNGGVRLRPWSIRWATVEQLDEMAAAAGLRLVERWETFDRAPFTSASTRHVSVYGAVHR